MIPFSDISHSCSFAAGPFTVLMTNTVCKIIRKNIFSLQNGFKWRMIMPLIHLPANVSVEKVVSCLKNDGYCIIDNAVSVEVIDTVNNEIQPFLDKTDEAENNALGKKTRRCGALAARSPASHQMMMHPTVLGATKALLCENATVMQLNLTQLISVGPGEKAQFLHRDEGAWDFFDHFPVDIQMEVSTIWAMDDFTELNGATRIIPWKS
ncbi:phytanoyl-CoA dioxygenase family protein [Klebsiella variicola subsp. variicola]|nr:phytanoyl-CoA dioxygenase family protein [Klebsiella variicola subsp. variicola]